jgi:threonylcarbamoyladenosine tRNA methylthiotransferase MtaB
MLSVLIHTLGCKLNQLESEAFADVFMQAGFTPHKPSDNTHPSIIIINTCTVTSKADQKARRVIRKALRDNPDSCVLVTGCYAQLDKAELDKLNPDNNGRLFVLKGMEKEKILELPGFINEKSGDFRSALRSWQEKNKTDIDSMKAFQFSPEHFSKHTRSFLKIQDGCDKHCTYCRIRLARGKSVSLGAEEVLERLQILEKTHAEAVLTGVNICRYRNEKTGGLGGLLEYLLAGTEKIAIRLSSLEPDYIDAQFAGVLANKRVRPHFHLSVQSGSEKVLQKMGRLYTGETVERAASLLRGAKDDPFLACDIITGFPGETEEEFEKTHEICKRMGFAWIHVFPYSKRPGTPAFSFTDTVQESEVTRRVSLLTDLAFKGRTDYVKRWIGREVEVLVEHSSAAKGFCRGMSENYLKLLVKYDGGKAPLPGTVLRCKITDMPNEPKSDANAQAVVL